MQQPPRQSILQRPVHGPSKANETSTERQYAQEQEKLRTKAIKAAGTHDRLQRSLYPTAEDKQRTAQDIQQHMETVLMSKLGRENSSPGLKSPDDAGPGVAKVLAVAEDQPWQNPSLVYRDAAEEKMARLQHEQQVAAANRDLMSAASLRKTLAHEIEQEEARRALQTPTFWNAGSKPGDRYAPHTLRDPRPGGNVTAPYAQDMPEAPYANPDLVNVGATVPAAASRHYAGANSSTMMEQIIQQQKTAPPASVFEPASHADDLTEYRPPTSARVVAPPLHAAGFAAETTVAPFAGESSVLPYATSLNNEAYRAPMPAARSGVSSAPYATAGNNAAYAPPRTAASRAYSSNATAAPFATNDGGAAGVGAPNTGLRYAARSAANSRSGVPWATDADPAVFRGGADGLQPTIPGARSRYTPTGVTSMSQILGGGGAPSPPAGALPSRQYTQSSSFPWLQK